MAFTTVEIIGGQLQGSIINNAASEATLRELVNAVNKMNAGGGGGSSSGGGSFSGGGSNPLNVVSNKVVKPLEKAFSLAVKQVSNVVGAMGSFAGMMATGERRMSEYGRTLNEQVVKQLPIVGGALGIFGDVLTTTIGIAESWNSSLMKATASGASFGNSIIEARIAAANLRIGLDDFLAIVNENRDGMASLGGTVSEGARQFSIIGEQLISSGLGTRLIEMGYSVDDIQSGLGKYLATTMRGVKLETANRYALGESFAIYKTELDKVTKLTGKNAEELEEQMAVASQDAAYKLKMASYDEDTRAKMQQGLMEFTARYGEAGAELFKQMALGMPPLTQRTQMLYATMPGAAKAIQQLQNAARSGAISQKAYGELADTVMVDSIMSAASAYKSFDQIFAAAASGADGTAQAMYQALGPILNELSRYGDPLKMTRSELVANIKKAKDDQRAREEFTRQLRRFDPIVRGIQTTFIKSLAPVIEALSPLMKYFNESLSGLGDKFKKFSEEVLLPFVRKAVPAIQTFFGWLSTDEGRNFIMEEIEDFWKYITMKMGHWIGAQIDKIRPFGWGAESARKEREREEQELKDSANRRRLNRRRRDIESGNVYEAPPTGPTPSTTQGFLKPGFEGKKISDYKDLFDVKGNWAQFDKLDPSFQQQIIRIAEVYKNATGKKMQLTDGFRTYQQQADAYRRKPNLAAPPGTSQHEKGLALDADSNALNWLANNINPTTGKSWLESYGLHRPVLHKGETWHLEPIKRPAPSLGGQQGNWKGSQNQSDQQSSSAPVSPGVAMVTNTGQNTSGDVMVALNSNIIELVTLNKQLLQVNQKQLGSLKSMNPNLVG